jgi:hypothetical protein
MARRSNKSIVLSPRSAGLSQALSKTVAPKDTFDKLKLDDVGVLQSALFSS